MGKISYSEMIKKAIANSNLDYSKVSSLSVDTLIKYRIEADKEAGVDFLTGTEAKSIVKDLKEKFSGVTKEGITFDKGSFQDDSLYLVEKTIAGVPVVVSFDSTSPNTESFVDFMYWTTGFSKIGLMRKTKQRKGGARDKSQCLAAAVKALSAPKGAIESFVSSLEDYKI